MMIRLAKLLTVFLLVLFALSFRIAVNAETPEEKLQRLTSEISQYEAEIQRLNSQANTLSNQIAQFDAQINLAQLKISQTQEKIALLGGRIDQLEVSLDTLTDAFSQRAVETYKISRLDQPLNLVLAANSINDAVLRFNYLKKIQQSDRDLLIRLQKAQSVYLGEKTEQEDLQADLVSQKSLLDSQKTAKASLLQATQNDEKKYQSLLSQAKAQLAAFNRFVVGQGGASLLSNQTKCNDWGCYYNQRDSQWGSIGMGGSSYTVAGYGCLITSVSMIASHRGVNITPIDIAVNSDAFVPNTGYLYHTFSANGVSVSISSISASQLDDRLASGPVIAGLYSGPDHFIVILRKEGDNYIMHDPFLENGNERPLTDQYQVGNITSLRVVSFN